MDNNNWRAAQGQVQIPCQFMGGEAVAAAVVEGGDWRTQLQPDSRQRIVNKITETLERHVPFSGQGLQELKNMAVRFEEKVYTAATSQSDYLRKISLKMLAIGMKSENPVVNSLQCNGASRENPQDPAVSQSMQSQGQVQIPGQVMGGEAVAAAGVEGSDWRIQLQPYSRQRIVNKIMDTLKRHLPFSGQEGLQELKKIAVRFEEKTYAAATSQSDYLRKISLKMLAIEMKSENPVVNSLQCNGASSENPQDPVSQSMQSQGQVQIPGQVMGGEAVAAAGVEGSDWRIQLQPYSRQRIVNKIVEALKRHVPFSGQGLQELEKIAVGCEEEIYSAATSELDYVNEISSKISTIETKSQNPMVNSLQSNGASSENPPDPGVAFLNDAPEGTSILS